MAVGFCADRIRRSAPNPQAQTAHGHRLCSLRPAVPLSVRPYQSPYIFKNVVHVAYPFLFLGRCSVRPFHWCAWSCVQSVVAVRLVVRFVLPALWSPKATSAQVCEKKPKPPNYLPPPLAPLGGDSLTSPFPTVNDKCTGVNARH